MPLVREITTFLEQKYPPQLAETWDRVGLVCGDPEQSVARVAVAVDVTDATVAEAVNIGAQLLVAHHPLLLRGVHTVATTTPKGRAIHQLIRNGVALYTAHTNADSAQAGVNDALAKAIGLVEVQPLSVADQQLDRLVVFIPRENRDEVIDAVDRVIGRVLGDYTRCAFWTEGTGTFTPGETAQPAIGHRGEPTYVGESRVEITIPRRRRSAVVAAMLAAHPYEEPAYDVIPLALSDRRQGLGRVGTLTQEVTLADFTQHVASVLPGTAGGVRAAGDPAMPVRRVGVCGGAGDSLLDVARMANVDAYVTADLRHHPASEALMGGGPALVDVSHWASEWLWCPVVADLIGQQWPGSVEATASRIVTDPWKLHVTQRKEA